MNAKTFWTWTERAKARQTIIKRKAARRKMRCQPQSFTIFAKDLPKLKRKLGVRRFKLLTITPV